MQAFASTMGRADAQFWKSAHATQTIELETTGCPKWLLSSLCTNRHVPHQEDLEPELAAPCFVRLQPKLSKPCRGDVFQLALPENCDAMPELHFLDATILVAVASVERLVTALDLVQREVVLSCQFPEIALLRIMHDQLLGEGVLCGPQQELFKVDLSVAISIRLVPVHVEQMLRDRCADRDFTAVADRLLELIERQSSISVLVQAEELLESLAHLHHCQPMLLGKLAAGGKRQLLAVTIVVACFVDG
mmetsp:Transcript_62164/g.145650  ORF Transcript_62164/g.145650 Transcript_62164/m.145650 type:complete len:248 (-) Transcript_62164:1061-1804(-)